jgi:hypothetical protein
MYLVGLFFVYHCYMNKIRLLESCNNTQYDEYCAGCKMIILSHLGNKYFFTSAEY